MSKCKKCNKQIEGGHYSTPKGIFCPECWDEVPQKEKDKALRDTLTGLAGVARRFGLK